MAAGTYTTLYQAGGSGDNIVPNGYIKQTERVWVDTYTIAFTNTNTTIDFAVVPQDAIITGIFVEIATSITQSSGTVSIGYSTDTSINSFLAPFTITTNLTRSSISLPGPGLLNFINYTGSGLTIVPMVFAGFQATPTNSAGTISLKLNNWTMTTGTVKTLVRYVGR